MSVDVWKRSSNVNFTPNDFFIIQVIVMSCFIHPHVIEHRWSFEKHPSGFVFCRETTWEWLEVDQLIFGSVFTDGEVILHRQRANIWCDVCYLAIQGKFSFSCTESRNSIWFQSTEHNLTPYNCKQTSFLYDVHACQHFKVIVNPKIKRSVIIYSPLRCSIWTNACNQIVFGYHRLP